MAKKEPDSKSDAAALLERAQAQLERVKLGRGVVGKLTNIGLAFFGIIAIVVARSDNPWIMGGAIVSAVAAFGFFVYRVTEFADKHPEAALLEGAEFVAYKKLQMSANATGREHNIARTLQNVGQFARVGVYDTAEGRTLLQEHLSGVVRDPSNILDVWTNQYGSFVSRESLLHAPGGSLKLESSWRWLDNGSFEFSSVQPFGVGSRFKGPSN